MLGGEQPNKEAGIEPTYQGEPTVDMADIATLDASSVGIAILDDSDDSDPVFAAVKKALEQKELEEAAAAQQATDSETNTVSESVTESASQPVSTNGEDASEPTSQPPRVAPEEVETPQQPAASEESAAQQAREPAEKPLPAYPGSNQSDVDEAPSPSSQQPESRGLWKRLFKRH